MRILATIVIAAVVALFPSPAAAQEVESDDEGGFEIRDEQPAGGIVIRPNSGVAPEDPGDRGGALQLTLLALIAVFPVVAFFAIRRNSRKALAARSGSG